MGENGATESFAIVLRTMDGASLDATLTLDHACEEFRLDLGFAAETLGATGHDYFNAFESLRNALAQRGLTPQCYGAARDVRPSGMSRSMGGGLQAYRMIMGKQARFEDVVHIFESGPDMDLCSPEEQEDYFEAWLKSLGWTDEMLGKK